MEASKSIGSNKSFEREKNVWKEIEKIRTFYFRIEWKRNMIKGSELVTGMEKVDWGENSPVQLAPKQENVQLDEKQPNS